MSSEIDKESAKQNPPWFVTTCWTSLMDARDGASPKAAEALEELCQTYWYPLYAYIRRRGYTAQDAEDLTQAFFHQLLEKNYLGAVDRRKGKFRSFLLAALNHFLANERVWRNAIKRGGKRTFVSLDDEHSFESRYLQEPATEQSPQTIFELRWANTVMELARMALQARYLTEKKGQLFDYLQRFLTEEPVAGEYDVLGKTMDMSSHAVTMAVHRLRQRYGDHIRAEIGKTVADPTEVEEELRHLSKVLRENQGE